MVVLVVFAFVAGAATAISPCVLPVLPVALSAGLTGGRRRPLGVVAGLVAAFTFATVALVYVISALGLPDNLLRDIAIAVLAGFGLVLLLPRAAARIEAALGRLTRRGFATPRGEGFGSGLVLGREIGVDRDQSHRITAIGEGPRQSPSSRTNLSIESASNGHAQTHHSQPTHDCRSTYALGRAAGFSMSQRLPSLS